jgi:biopolymer transport protein ExbD
MHTSSKTHLAVIALIVIAVGVSCSRFLSQTSNSNDPSETKAETGERAGLIDDETGDVFYLTDKEVVVALSADNTLYREEHSPVTDQKGKITKAEITREQFDGLLKGLVENETPDKRIVYLNVDGKTTYEDVLRLMDLIRKADIDRVGLIYVDENRAKFIDAVGVEVRLPAPSSDRPQTPVKPGPLTLVATLRPDGRLFLNNENERKISESQLLGDHLKDVLIQREDNVVFRGNTNEIEKTVLVKAYRSAKFIDILKLLSIVKTAGAKPIGMQMDDLED